LSFGFQLYDGQVIVMDLGVKLCRLALWRMQNVKQVCSRCLDLRLRDDLGAHQAQQQHIRGNPLQHRRVRY
jgi:hypothetical protein